MAYRLKRREGIASGVRRIVAGELERAIDELEGRRSDDAASAVHEARKHLKKARAAIRLVRFDVGADLRRSENAALRDAQAKLSGARDAEVTLQTLSRLENVSNGRLPARAAHGLRRALRDRRNAMRRNEDQDRADAIAELQAARGRVNGWPLHDESFATAAKGLHRIYRDGRRAQPAANETDAAEPWHEWRKRVKDLWYAARILRPVAPLELGAVADEADELAELLGDHNDLAVLRAAIDDHPDATTDQQARQLRAVIDDVAADLRRRAVPLGLRLYAEPPKRFVARVSAYWEARDAQRDAEAQWLDRATATRLRTLLRARSRAGADDRDRIGRELRSLGFRVSEAAKHVDTSPADFSARDFDALIERGTVRLREPDDHRMPSSRKNSVSP
jgi:CHAD domain-containing protein